MPLPEPSTLPGLPTERVFVALGSNLGKREAWLHFALKALETAPFWRLLACSPFLETQAVLLPHQNPQPPYLNAVAEGRCACSPLELLRFLLEIEAKAGRKPEKRKEARTLDLDLLSFGERQVELGELQLPHPRLHMRAFVLSPWACIAPEWKLPGRKESIAELYARLA